MNADEAGDFRKGRSTDPREQAILDLALAITRTRGADAAPAACAKNEGDGARADRAVHRRRPASYAAWLVLGGIGTYVDHIHELFGVVAYPDPTWIGERLPVSPAYLAAGVGFFLMYTAVVGHRGRSQGLFGGRPLSLLEFVIALGSWLIAYTATGALGAMGGVHPVFPWLAAALLLVWALPELWLARRTWFIAYAAIVAASGVTFEWIATAGGGYVYPVCPSSVCAGTSVPIVWLSLLYVHVALFVHRLQGGRSFVARWLAQRLG